ATVTGTSFSAALTLSEGSHQIRATAEDAGGNLSDAGSFTVLVDLTKPTLHVPANQVLTANALGGATATFSAQASDAGSDIWTVTPIPTFFALGKTTVNVTATDNAGNETTASFTVTVNPGPASKFGFVTAPQIVTAGVVSNTITVQLQDAFGNAVKAHN